jgi:CDP-diacylglycerol--serine O-phosphatidyltransferase
MEGDKPEYFKGLPIPVQAAAIVSLILNFDDASWFNDLSISTLSLLIPFVAVLAGLMVSTIPFDALPKPTPAFIRKHPYKTGAFLFGCILTIFLQQIGLLISIMAYVLYGLFNALRRAYRAVMSVPVEEAQSSSVSSE